MGVVEMNFPTSLIEAFKRVSEIEDRGINFINGDSDTTFISYRQLYFEALHTLDFLNSKGVSVDDELVLYFEEKDMNRFVTYYWACILGGIIPVPLATGNNNEHRKKLFEVWVTLKNPYIITDQSIWDRLLSKSVIDPYTLSMHERVLFYEHKDSRAHEPHHSGISRTSEEIAFIQFSSGSTGTPKGVVLTHQNLMYNIRDITTQLGITAKDSTLSWMPLTHDMGLIVYHLLPLVSGLNQHLIATSTFIRRPMLWMKKISDHKITFTGSPNFGLKYLFSKFKKENAEHWDLSSLRIILNGAEPIAHQVSMNFMQCLAPYQLRADAMFAAYGLAEASVGVSAGKLTSEPLLLHRKLLTIGNAIHVTDDQEEGLSVVHVGTVFENCDLRITDDNDVVVPDRFYGHVQIKGKNVTQGYYHNEEATAKLKTLDGWTRTGDLGFFVDRKLYVIGRYKDIIFVNGQNVYPHDIERVAEGFENIELGKVAACGVYDTTTNEDQIILFVVHKDSSKDFSAYAARLKGYINEQTGWKITDVVPVRQLPKTTSGKVQRYKLADEYSSGMYKSQSVPSNEAVDEETRAAKKSPKEQVEEFENKLVKIFKDVLSIHDVNKHDRFFEIGATSIQLTEIATQVEDELNIVIPTSDFFSYPTINQLANYLLGTESQEIDVKSKTKRQKEVNDLPHFKKSDIAIIGMSGEFAGAADLDEYWRIVATGQDAIGPLSEERAKDARQFINRKNNDFTFVEGGFLKEIDKFDYSFFGMTPKEAELMDPNQRLFLQTAWHTLENAGYGGGQLSGRQVGVFVGASKIGQTYEQLVMEGDNASIAQYAVGNLSSIISGRISYLLNFKGPAITIDTACSSSLVAVHMACESIIRGESELAIAGGVRTLLLPIKSGIGMESSDDRARSFDDDSDGTGTGEGVASILLKSLEQAVADGDYIHAVIKGSAINQDGATVGMTAPNTESQTNLILKAWQNAEIEPETISYIETHGTGTPLGDPIEINAISHAFQKHTSNKQFCGIGSVKANIGHLYEAAGIASLIKTILCLQHTEIPPLTHFKKPNRNIHFLGTPLYVPTNLTNWQTNNIPRRSGVSSFGFSGTNCHVVLEEYNRLEQPVPTEVDDYQLFTLSAKTHDSLYELVKKYTEFLSCNVNYTLKEICYTANIGRTHFPLRIGIVARTLEELRSKLTEVLIAGGLIPKEHVDEQSLIQDFSKQASEILGKYDTRTPINKKDIEILRECYIQGANFDLSKGDSKPNKVPLPVYPFMKKRCWVERTETSREKMVRNEAVVEEDRSVKKTLKNTADHRELLKDIFQKITGFSRDEINTDSHFLEMGIDSIMLNQVKISIMKQFSVDIPVNLLFESVTSLNKLNKYIMEHAPLMESDDVQHSKEASQIITPKNVIRSAPASRSTDSSFLSIMEQQINLLNNHQKNLNEIFTQQLDLMRMEQGGAVEQVSTSVSMNSNSDRGEISIEHIKEHRDTTLHADLQPKQKVFVPFQPIVIRSESGLSKEQQHFMDSFIEEYTKKTKQSKKYTQTYRKVHANNRNASGFRSYMKEMVYPVIAEKSMGSRLWDLDGNEYIDLTMGFGVNLFGHNPSFITDELKIEISSQPAPLGPMSNIAGQVSELIREITGCERVAFYNSGTEAIMVAIRLARAQSGRSKIVLFSGSYHGTFDGVLGVADMNADDGEALPMAPGIPESYLKDVLILNYNSPHALEVLERYKDEIAAVVVEPIQSRRPDLQPKAFIQEIRTLTEQSGIALIFDEVITGFRIDIRGSQGWYDIEADIAVYGKVVGGGMPIGVVAGKSKYLDAVDGGYWEFGDDSYPPHAEIKTFVGGTFCTHPITMKAALKTLEYLKDRGPGLQRELNERTNKLMHTLNEFFKQENVPIHMVNCGSLFRFVSFVDIELFYYLMIKNGVYIWEGRNCFLSTAHTEEDINKIVRAVYMSIYELKRNTFFQHQPDLDSPLREVEKTSEVYPVTSEQKQLWFASKARQHQSAAFTERVALELKGSIDVEKLTKALQTITGRHEALRTVIDHSGEQQMVLTDKNVEINTTDLTADLRTAKDLVFKEWMAKESENQMELSPDSTLTKYHLLKMEKNYHIFVMSFHHIIADGWSISVVVDELHKLYSAYCSHEHDLIELPAPGQFREYLDWREKQFNTLEHTKAVQYWKSIFAEPVKNIVIPSITEDMLKREFQGKRIHFKLEKSVTDKLRKLSIHSQNSLFVTLFAVYKVFVHRLTGYSKLVIGIPVSGQAQMQNYNLIGNCASVLPVVSKVNKGGSFRDYLASLKEAIKELEDVKKFPFSMFIDSLNFNHVPELNVLFNMDRPISKTKLHDLDVKLIPTPIQYSKYDLFMNVMDVNGELWCELDVNTQLVQEHEIDLWVSYFNELVSKITENEDSHLENIIIDHELEHRMKALVSKEHTLNSCISQQDDSVQAVESNSENISITEEKLTAIWKEILSIRKIGVHDSFFELGGNSLQATTIFSRIHKEFNISIPLSELFISTTIRAMSRYIENCEGSDRTEYTPIPSRDILLAENENKLLEPHCYPLSNAQERVWFRAQFTGHAYGDVYLYEFKNGLHIEIFQQAVNILIERHEIMRTTISEVGGVFYQKVHHLLKVPFEYADLAHYSDEEQRERIAEDAQRQKITEFDLTVESFYRMKLYHLADQQFIFLLSVHHIGHDGWSHYAFLNDLFKIYSSLIRGEDPHKIAQPRQYADFSLWQHKQITTKRVEKQREYWKEKLQRSAPVLQLPGDSEEKIKEQETISEICRYTLTPELTKKIYDLNVSSGRTTNFITVLAALKIWMAHVTDETLITIGSTLSGRTHPDLEGMIGLCINPVAMRTELSGNPTMQDVLQRVADTCVGAYTNQEYPFDLVMQDQYVMHDQIKSLYSVCLIGQNAHTTKLQNDEIDIRFCNLDEFQTKGMDITVGNYEMDHNEKTKLDLLIYLFDNDDQLLFEIYYNHTKFCTDTIQNFFEQMEQVLDQMVNSPSMRLSQVKLNDDTLLQELFN
ncbi:aminotransferase class III-fold pyridoxal phosphate-dependent enzyme [Paenibacillus amylolyticus]|nr:aminotransferase class III-fold pyridoxal phosphate-dependent enzyme [Paenibacillus amylolyticus]